MQLIDDQVKENAQLKKRLQSSEREKQTFAQQVMRKDAELTRAEETIMKIEQHIQERKQKVSCVPVYSYM